MHSVAPAEWNSLNQFSCLLGQRCSQHFSHLTQVNPWHVLTLQRCHFGSHVAFGIKANTSAWKWCCRTSLSFLLRLLLGVIAWSPMLLHGSLALFAQTFCYRCLQTSKLERFLRVPLHSVRPAMRRQRQDQRSERRFSKKVLGPDLVSVQLKQRVGKIGTTHVLVIHFYNMWARDGDLCVPLSWPVLCLTSRFAANEGRQEVGAER